MFQQQTVMKRVNYLDNVESSEVIPRKVISYKVKSYVESDGSISYGVMA